MSETTKTAAFVGVAVVVLAVAWSTRPAPATFDSAKLVDTQLYEFDPLEARRLKVVGFNALTGRPQEFEVAQVDNTWSIPSKEGYPADAQDRMADAANAINGTNILFVASESAAEHRLYGVLDPRGGERKIGDDGVGTRITIEDQAGKILADAVIGNEVKDAPGQRYVRRAGQDVVVVTEVDPKKFSTSFADWIEKDLLKLNPWDIRKVRINDYTSELVLAATERGFVPRLRSERRADTTLAYDDSTSKWTAESLLVYDPATQEYREQPLQPDEELNSQTINDLKNALDDLRIVDVAKKPSGLSADLQTTEDFLETIDEEALRSLMAHGFAPVGNQDGTLDIASTEGEVIVTLNTGVEYVLRFGEVQTDDDGAAIAAADADEGAGGDAAQAGNLNRYIFVVARFNEDAIGRPELETPPDLPAGVKDEAPTPAAQEPTEEEAPAVVDEDAEATPEDDADDSQAIDVADESTDTDDASLATEADAEDASADDSAATDESDQQSETERILADRKRIDQENQRKLDEYADKITKGKEIVQELNARFGDWYYVVDDAEYKRIHLSREQLIQDKESADDEANGDEAVDAAGFGLPGGPVPGLPNIPGLLEATAEETSSADDAEGAEEQANE